MPKPRQGSSADKRADKKVSNSRTKIEQQTDSHATSSPIRKLRYTHHVSFSPDTKRIVAAMGGRVRDLSSGEETARCELPPDTSYVTWSPNGNAIAFQSTSGAIRICDAQTGKKLAQVKMECEGSMMQFSPDGKTLVAGDWGGNLFCWRASSWKLAGSICIEGMINHLTVSESEVAVVTNDVAIGFDPALKDEQWRVTVDHLENACVHYSVKTPVVYGWAGDRVVKKKVAPRARATGTTLELESDAYHKPIVISPDGQYVCAIHGKEFILLDEKLKEIGRQHIDYAHSASFSSDSTLIALSTWDKGEVWRLDQFPKEPIQTAKPKKRKKT